MVSFSRARAAHLISGFAVLTWQTLASGSELLPVANSPVNRISAEVGPFRLPKSDESGIAFGVGYAFRPLSGLEVGAGLRLLRLPAGTEHPTSAFNILFAAASLRVYQALDSTERFELGIAARGGLLSLDGSAACCGEFALSPDLRVRIGGTTALQLSPELAFASTNAHASGSEPMFLQTALWLSLVQSL